MEYFIGYISYKSFKDIYGLYRWIDKKKKYIIERKNLLLYMYVYT